MTPPTPPPQAIVTCPRCGGLGLRFNPHVSSIKTTCEACKGTGQVAAPAGWIAWGGGECPVAPETVIDIEARNGVVLEDFRAGTCSWFHNNSETDIIAYRLAPQSQKGGDEPCPSARSADKTIIPDVARVCDAAPDVPPVADAADFMCHDCKRPMSQCVCYEASRRQIKPPATPSVTPETDAFMTLIDDSEIALGMVRAYLGDMETQRNRYRDRLCISPQGDDEIDALQSAMDFLKAERDNAQHNEKSLLTTLRTLERQTQRDAARIASLERELAQIEESLKVTQEISDTFWAALKLLKLTALDVTNPGRHFTDRIAELEAALREAATVFDDLDAVMWDRSGCPVQYTDAQNAVNEALAARKENQ